MLEDMLRASNFALTMQYIANLGNNEYSQTSFTLLLESKTATICRLMKYRANQKKRHLGARKLIKTIAR